MCAYSLLLTGLQVAEQHLELGVAVLVVVFKQVAPEDLDGGSSLLQNPGQERVHGPVDPLSAFFLQSVLLKFEQHFSMASLQTSRKIY